MLLRVRLDGEIWGFGGADIFELFSGLKARIFAQISADLSPINAHPAWRIFYFIPGPTAIGIEPRVGVCVQVEVGIGVR